jgi:hypothetical protein
MKLILIKAPKGVFIFCDKIKKDRLEIWYICNQEKK